MVDRVLVVGSGGREHALAWKIAQSPEVDEVVVAPGNGGTYNNVDIPGDNINELAAYALEEDIKLTVVGPEGPLAAGIADTFERFELPIFGPTKQGAMLEASKVYAREMMQKYRIPQPVFCVYENPGGAELCVREYPNFRVIKADGLCKGKGVAVASTLEEAVDACHAVQQRFGDAASKLLVEQKLVGEEASIIALTDGTTIVPLPSSQDHKPIFDGDKGPNTGGMGAYSPAPVVDTEVMAKIEDSIFKPTLRMLRNEGIDFRGVLYYGLMIVNKDPYVLEINVRFGDPELQPIVMRLQSDLYPYLKATAEGRLSEMPPLEVDPRPACCVVMASGGYPESYNKGMSMWGLTDVPEGVQVFHAGTKMDTIEGEKILLTNGGRVLGVTALGNTFEDAIRNAYEGVSAIHWTDEYHRADIGHRAIGRDEK